MKTRILITGATGKTGLPLAQQLADRNVPFRALVHSVLKEHLVKKWTPDIVTGDYQESAEMEKAFDGIERVYLVSPPAPDQEKVQTSLVDIAKKKGVKHIVKLSALGASGASPVGLLRAHAGIENYIRKSGIAWTFLRPHFFMENLLANAESAGRDGALYSPLGDAGISAISVHDIAAVAAEVLTGEGHEGRIYQLTGPESLSFAEIASILGSVINRNVVYVPVTFEAARLGMIHGGMTDWLAEDIIRLMKTWSEGRGSVVTRDAAKILGRQPISVREFFECHKDLFAGAIPKAA